MQPKRNGLPSGDDPFCLPTSLLSYLMPTLFFNIIGKGKGSVFYVMARSLTEENLLPLFVGSINNFFQ